MGLYLCWQNHEFVENLSELVVCEDLVVPEVHIVYLHLSPSWQVGDDGTVPPVISVLGNTDHA